MKTLVRTVSQFTAAAALLLSTAGCNTVPTQTNQYVGAPKYAATDPASVQILRTEPTQQHVRLGEITAEPSSTKTPTPEIETKLQQAAAKMGANALVIVVDQTQATGAVVMGPWYGRQVEPVIGRVIRGVAIRYTNSPASQTP
jgi:hypothetical protein